MIIKKQDFKNQDDWPFLVDEIKIKRLFNKLDTPWSVIVYLGKTFGLSGVEVQMGHAPLSDSGIWSDNPEIPGTKKSLTPVFEYIEGMK